MKTIKSCDMKKYEVDSYRKVSDGVYSFNGKFVTCLSFQQEPALGEGKNAAEISQYPLEDILDHFSVFVSDFFKDLNTPKSSICYLEFTGFSLDDIQALRGIIGKHVYNKRIRKNNNDYIELIIE